MKILIVDDEPSNRYLLKRIFEREGYDVAEAHHGAGALRQVAETRPDLVVTDLMMPVMGGGELIRRLRSDPGTAAIPIVVLSSVRDIGSDLADAVLGKPFEVDELIKTVRTLTGG